MPSSTPQLSSIVGIVAVAYQFVPNIVHSKRPLNVKGITNSILLYLDSRRIIIIVATSTYVLIVERFISTYDIPKRLIIFAMYLKVPH